MSRIKEIERMLRLIVIIVLSSYACAQSLSDVAAASKSPTTLTRYLESHRTVDWKRLRQVLGLKESEYWIAPCGGDFFAAESPCTAETITVANPVQAIVIIRGSDFSFADEYLRYLRRPNGEWKFAGEMTAYKRNGPSNHGLVQLGAKPFLKISSNHSQIGVSVQQELEEWFDLTLTDFEPVFSFTPDGSEFAFGVNISRDIKAQSSFNQAAGLEQIDMTLSLRFDGTPGLDVPAAYVGIYERHANEKKFRLRTAYSALDHRTMPTKDFEDLANPFGNPAREKLIVYALPGLTKIAVGSDVDDKEWLRGILDQAKSTPEVRMLSKLLTKP